MPPVFTREILHNFKNSNEELKKFHYVLGRDIKKTLRRQMMTVSCMKINPSYMKDTNDALTDNEEEFSMVAMFPNEKQMVKEILGFIVLQHGECKTRSDSYSINLICSNQNKGKILMGLALYAIKTNDSVVDKTCVLELAGGYLNASGFCMYSKFGFVANTQLYSKDCFNDTNNLPMDIMLDNISSEQIIISSITSSATNESLCKDRAKQQFLGMAMNLKTRLELTNLDELKIVTVQNYSDVSYDYDKLLENCKNNNTDVYGLIHEIENAKSVDDIKFFFDNGTIIEDKKEINPPPSFIVRTRGNKRQKPNKEEPKNETKRPKNKNKSKSKSKRKVKGIIIRQNSNRTIPSNSSRSTRH